MVLMTAPSASGELLMQIHERAQRLQPCKDETPRDGNGRERGRNGERVQVQLLPRGRLFCRLLGCLEQLESHPVEWFTMSSIVVWAGSRCFSMMRTFSPLSELSWKRSKSGRCESEATVSCPTTVMPNHWHFVLWPENDGDLGRFILLSAGADLISGDFSLRDRMRLGCVFSLFVLFSWFRAVHR